ncbi:MAG: DUF948 domain-containing protein [Deltaproteobacteria bacterium]|nr:DUF948 domain-containing protein [Deltaproteobacteria bacterium]
MNLEIILIILVVFLLIIGILAIPFLMQIRKTLNNLNDALETLNRHLPGILQNMEDLTTNVNGITGHVNKQVEAFSVPALRLQALFLNLVVGLENTLQLGAKFPLIKAAMNLPAVVKGFQVFFHSLRSKDNG